MDLKLSDARIDISADASINVGQDYPLCLALGMFDGVHLGHQSVIKSAVSESEVCNGVAGVLTFDPHPSRVLRPDQATEMIYPLDVKRERLFSEGISLIFWKAFTKKLASVPSEAFLEMIKSELPQLNSIHVGSNFRFGAKRSGDVDLLAKCGKEIGVNVFNCARVRLNGEAISSSRIRELLEMGDISTANLLLGQKYYSKSTIISGNQIGKTIGFPTLNLMWNPEKRPRYGVYVVEFTFADGGKTYRGVANYGVRPTVTEDVKPTLEIHSLDPLPSKHSSPICVGWLDFLRAEKKFADVEQLVRQIVQDKADAASYFKIDSGLS